MLRERIDAACCARPRAFSSTYIHPSVASMSSESRGQIVPSISRASSSSVGTARQLNAAHKWPASCTRASCSAGVPVGVAGS